MNKMAIIFRMLQNRISFEELVRFLYGETPPKDNNYLAYNYSRSIKKISRFNANQIAKPLFSVIVATYNRCELLKKTLEAIARQKEITVKDVEIIIADNGSTDKTEETAADFFNNGLSGVYIKLAKNYGADFARNVAVLNSRGDLLAFTDDDCIVPDNWLAEFKKELEADPEIAGVGGFKVPRSTREHLDIYHRFLMWKHFYWPHVRTKEFDLSQNHCGLTANVCYRKDNFKKMGGFNLYFKHIGFQEFKTRVHKSGLKLLYEPKMAEHYAYFTFITHISKLFPQSLDRYLLYKLYPNVWPNPSFLYFLKRTINDIKLIFNSPTAQERSRYLMRSEESGEKVKISDKIRFSFLSIVTNFCLWFGKYWVIAFG